MNIENLTGNYIYIDGPIAPGETDVVDDEKYNKNDVLASVINSAYAGGSIDVTDAPDGFPRSGVHTGESGESGGAPSGPAGGSLDGTYPDPTIAALAINTPELALDSVDSTIIDGADAASILSVLGVGQMNTYTPTLTASSSNPTLGVDGSQTGRYVRIGNLVVAWAQVVFGTSGTAVGSGNYRIALPVACIDPTIPLRIGVGFLSDATTSASSRVVVPYVSSGATSYAQMQANAANTTVNEASPITWGANDSLHLLFVYPTS